MSSAFPKSLRIRTRRQYQRIAEHSKRFVGRFVIIDVRPSRYPATKLGITATKHFGIAVRRNRFKRIVREAFRTCRTRLQPGCDINVKPRKVAHAAKMSDILNELVAFLSP